MLFTSPWFLVLLAPWLALTLLLLWGRRRRVDIPFLNLWKGPVQSPAPKRSFERPPAWLAAAIGAMLLAILAAAGPAMRQGGDAGPLLTIIVDRGLTMSGETRYHALIDEAAAALAGTLPRGPTQLLSVPGDSYRTDRSNWPAMAKAIPPTAADTREALRAAVHDRLAGTKGSIIVLTDQPLAIDSPRVVRIAPAQVPQNVAIETLAVRESPAPQVMLRLRNESPRATAAVRLHSDQRPVKEVELGLPAAGGSGDYFIDLPAIGDTIAAQLLESDDVPADDQFSLVRQRLWPVIEPRASLPAELQRVIASYGRLRPPGQASTHIAIVIGQEALPLNEPAAALAVPAGETQLVSETELTITDHPVTQSVELWPVPDAPAAPRGEGWVPLVRKDGKMLVAVRTEPARQVWVGVPAAAWSAHPSFVIFWTNVFDYLGAGGESFGHRPVGRLAGAWTPLAGVSHPSGVVPGLWPGLYQRADGAIAAVNASPGEFKSVPADWRSGLRGLPMPPGGHRLALAPVLLLITIGLLLFSASAWKAAVG